MKFAKRIYLLSILLWINTILEANPDRWRKYEYIQPKDIEITIKPDKPEIIAGDTATFTLTIRNKTKEPVSVFFPTGQRWDMAAYHNNTQIWQYSQGMRWDEVPHSITIKPGIPESVKLGWPTRDRNGAPLPQGVYRVQGIVVTYPRRLVSNMTSIRLLPPKVTHKGILKVKINQTFAIELPRYYQTEELTWTFDWIYNDNRLKYLEQRQKDDKTLIFFRADRRGHVVVHFYGYPVFRKIPESYERQTYRIEIFENLD